MLLYSTILQIGKSGMLPATKNQNPEQIARDQIDAKLAEAGFL